MTNFSPKLEEATEDQLRSGINKHAPDYAQLESEELTRRALSKLEETIRISNQKSDHLETASFKLQLTMMYLAIVTTLVAVYPIIKAVFLWSTPVILTLINKQSLSLVFVNGVSAVLSTAAAAVMISVMFRESRLERIMRLRRKL